MKKKQTKFVRFIPMIGSPLRIHQKLGELLYKNEYQKYLDFGRDCGLDEPEIRYY